MSQLIPISRDEFRRIITKCKPPTGWASNIGVGNSGGPDSTCLLFLLHRFLFEAEEIPPLAQNERTAAARNTDKNSKDALSALLGRSLAARISQSHQNSSSIAPSLLPTDETAGFSPRRVISLTVDHNLQEASAEVAKKCQERAERLGIPHITSLIPWGTHPFPQKPQQGESFEGIARDVRYHVLFDAMKRWRPDFSSDLNNEAAKDNIGIGILALGHHADDQVETAMMRVGKGSTLLGARGMRYCRRWGMGMGSGVGWAGIEGMDRWIIRPLLDVSKDRILATCEANGLDYVTDKTNFQPDITLRNALRMIIHNPQEAVARLSTLPEGIIESLMGIEEALKGLKTADISLTSGPEQLRGAIQQLGFKVDDIESQVDSGLKRCLLPSPHGTVLLSCRGLTPIINPLVRSSMILRIMRAVSFHPWGSIRADGNRRSASLQQIIDNVWTQDPFSANINLFVAGGGVLWAPVVVRGQGIKTPDRVASIGIEPGDIIGWLASRQPPMNKRIMTEKGLMNPLVVDITDQLLSGAQQKSEALEVLYDNRFTITFDLTRMGEFLLESLRASQKLIIKPQTRWYWPQVVLEDLDGSIKTVHSHIDPPSRVISVSARLGAGAGHEVPEGYWRPKLASTTSEWISVKWIRPLSAI